MEWQTAAAMGAAGALLFEAVILFGKISEWQAARKTVRRARRRRRLPPLRDYVDPCPDVLVGLFRCGLGAAAGWLFHSQITTVYAAAVIGVAAPSLIQNLGATKAVRNAIQGGAPAPVGSVPGPSTGEASPAPSNGEMGPAIRNDTVSDVPAGTQQEQEVTE
ncbi:hypothetical protein AB0I99_27340 [Streptomyces spongiicola]|uniref:hypothetical protein n=1 Tax=Streptomyces spongiicola TaxID=1690221 RepID=UPI0033E7B8FD